MHAKITLKEPGLTKLLQK